MKILHINSNYLQSSLYKTQKNEMDFQRENENIFFVPLVNNKTNNKYKNIIEEHNLYAPLILNKYDKYLYFFRKFKIEKFVRKNLNIVDYNHIFAYSLFSNGGVAYSLYKKYGISYTVLVQNTDLNTYFPKMLHLRSYVYKIITNASNIIFISESYKNSMIEKFIKNKDKDDVVKKSTVIPFGIDNFWFNNQVEDKKINRKQNFIKLLFVGKINSNKNIDLLINAVRKINKNSFNCKLTLIGDIEDLSYKSFIYENREYVEHIGFLEKEELLKKYREHDIFVMASFRESFGLVYAEAMTQGLPVIYTRGQGFDKQFTEGTVGYSVDPNDVDELIKKINLIDNSYEMISEKCIKESKKFKWLNIIDKYTKLKC